MELILKSEHGVVILRPMLKRLESASSCPYHAPYAVPMKITETI